MRFQTSATLLGLLALFSVQVIAQDSSATESEVSATAIPDSTASDVPSTTAESATESSPAEPSSAESSPDAVTSSVGSQSTATPLVTSADSATTGPSATSAGSLSVSASSAAPAPTGASGECQDGFYQCSGDSSPEFQWCVFGKWTQASCAQGTICKSIEGNNIACDWPTAGNASD